MVLPVNIDIIYSDDSSDASVKLHQQHHDVIHTFVDAGAPKGVVGYARASAAQTGITTITDITGCTVTWTATSTRLYKILVHFPTWTQNTAAGLWRVFVTTPANGQVAQALKSTPAGSYDSVVSIHYETGLSGSTTRKVRTETNAGTGDTVSGWLPIIIVEDIGAA